ALRGTHPSLAFGDGRLYLGHLEAGRSRIVMINLTGRAASAHGIVVPPASITTVAGGQPGGFSGDGGPALKARLSVPSGLAADPDGALYIADEHNNRVRKVDSGGLITTIAGAGPAGKGGFNGNYIPARRARLDRPVDVEWGADRLLYISDRGNAQVRIVDAEGIIRPAYGNWLASRCAEDPSEPKAGQLSGAAVGPGGDVYFGAPAVNAILRAGPGNKVERVLWTEGRPCKGGGNCLKPAGLDEALQMGAPVAVGAARGGLYVFDESGVAFVNLSAKTVRANGVDIPARSAGVVLGGRTKLPDPSFLRPGSVPPPAAIAADPAGNVYFADGAGLLRLSKTGKLSTLAAIPSADGCCSRPASMTTDEKGNLYVGDFEQSRIWFFNRSGTSAVVHGITARPHSVTVVAGNGAEGPGGEGVKATDTSLDGPGGLAVDARGNLFFSETRSHLIRKLDAAGVVTTVAGTGQSGFNGDGLTARLAAFRSPAALSFDRCGNLLVADSGNDRIRRITLVENCRPPSPAGGPGPKRGLSPWLLLPVVAAAAAAGYFASTRLKSG
ncbi:MAG: hypothetical protein ACRDIA_06420, partial [Actinomycetota bacterium]